MEPDSNTGRQDTVNSEETIFYFFELVEHRHYDFFFQVQSVDKVFGINGDIERFPFDFWDFIESNPTIRVVIVFELVFVLKYIDNTFENFVFIFGWLSLPSFFYIKIRFNRFEQFSFGMRHDFVCESEATLTVKQITQRDSSQLVKVIVIQKHVATGKFAVSASSTDLLDIVLDRTW